MVLGPVSRSDLGGGDCGGRSGLLRAALGGRAEKG